MHRFALILTALLISFAAACGNDQDPDIAPATPTPTPATPEPTPPMDDDAAEEFARLFEGFPTAEFIVTFQMDTADLDAPTNGEFTGEWTWYQGAGGERQRFDFDGAVAGFEGTMTVISTPDETYICVGASCLRAPEGVPLHGNPGEAFVEQVTEIDDRVRAGEVRDAGTRSVAGLEARCFEFEDAGNEDANGTVCLSPDGVPLFAEFDAAEGTFRLEATSYSDSVSDEDFEAPHPVTQM